MDFVNSLTLYGKVLSNEKEYEFTDNNGKTLVFYKIELECRRKNKEVTDIIPVIVNYPIAKTIQLNTYIMVNGAISSRKSNDDDGKNIIETFAYAKAVYPVTEEEYEESYARNEELINGIVTREPRIRKTNKKRKVASFVVAIHRPTTSHKIISDYVQCVAWDDLAEIASEFKIGDEISLCGRFQSRTYTTQEDKTRTIHEVVLSEVSRWEDSDE